MRPLLLALVGILLLASPCAVAQSTVPYRDAPLASWNVSLIESQAAGWWTVEETLTFAPPGTAATGPTFSRFWLPQGATVTRADLVLANGTRVPTDWYLYDRDAAVATWGLEEPERLRVIFTINARFPAVVAPENATRALVNVLPSSDETRAFLGPEFQPLHGALQANFTDVTAGTQLAPARAGTLDVKPAPPSAWIVLAVLSVLTLAIGAAWARARVTRAGDDAPLLVHLGELQGRIRVILAFFALYTLVFFTCGIEAFEWRGFTLYAPYFTVDDSIATSFFHTFAQQLVPSGVSLIVTRPMDAVLAQVQVTLLLSVLAVTPLAAHQIGAFLAPALQADERRAAGRAVPLVVGLFLAGLAFAYLLVIPLIMRTLYAYADVLEALPLLAISDLVSFATVLLLVFGFAFELPVLMAALSRAGLVKAATWAGKWRHATVVILIVAAIVTPDPSVVSQLIVGIPLIALYLAGVLAARAASRTPTQA